MDYEFTFYEHNDKLEKLLRNIDSLLQYSDSVKISLEGKSSGIGRKDISALREFARENKYSLKVETELFSQAKAEPVHGQNCEEGVTYNLMFLKAKQNENNL
jgi:hypothetical protein